VAYYGTHTIDRYLRIVPGTAGEADRTRDIAQRTTPTELLIHPVQPADIYAIATE
jgi:hypothetical protein